jgi:hypothetical protein
MSDNLLVKTQGLMNLLSAKIPKEYALPIVNLFSDSTAVVQEMEKNEEIEIENMKNMTQVPNQQNNKINNTMQKNMQEQ